VSPATEVVELQPRWLSVKAAANYASLSDRSVRALIYSGKLPASRAVRGRVLVDRLLLDALLTAESGKQLRRGRGIRRPS
jgi:excisionase family DNA binding protein